jgi:malate dehydrogenase (oxaloacetate-decarboxylating)
MNRDALVFANVLCFPGIFRGALDVRARDITEGMKLAAARGIASIVADAVADAVAAEAKRQGATDVRGDEIGYTRGETGEFQAIRP